MQLTLKRTPLNKFVLETGQKILVDFVFRTVYYNDELSIFWEHKDSGVTVQVDTKSDEDWCLLLVSSVDIRISMVVSPKKLKTTFEYIRKLTDNDDTLICAET